MTFHVDDRNQQIHIVVEDVSGIAEAISKAIAREYDAIEGLRQTDRKYLETVLRDGEQCATAVLDRVR